MAAHSYQFKGVPRPRRMPLANGFACGALPRVSKKLSPEHRRKIGDAIRGMEKPPRSVQWREKQRLVNLGRIHPQETRDKMSESAKRAHAEGRNKSPMNFGHHLYRQNGLLCQSKAEARYVAVASWLGLDVRRWDRPPLPITRADGKQGSWSPDFLEGSGGREFMVEVKGLRGKQANIDVKKVSGDRTARDLWQKSTAHPQVRLIDAGCRRMVKMYDALAALGEVEPWEVVK